MAASSWMRPALTLAACAGLAASLAAPALAQRKRAPEVNGWNAPQLDLGQIAPAAARADARRQVDRLLDVLKGMPTLAAPAFPIYASVQGTSQEGVPATYDIRVSFYRPGMVGTAMDDQVRFQVNDPSTLWDTERGQSVHTFGERELRAEPRFERTWHGYPINGRDYIVVARPGRELFRPVSVKEYFGLLTADLRAKGRNDESGVYATMLLNVQHKYDALSPAQRAGPAFVCADGFDEDTYLCLAGAAGARRLVEFNPGYWDPAAPRTAFQLLVLYRYNPDKTDGPVGQALTAAWDGLDWSSWRRLLQPQVP